MSVLNSAISSNRQMYNNLSNSSIKSNKTYLIASYSTDKTQYYNDQELLKKQKRKKRNKILTLSFASVATTIIAFGLVFELAKKGKFDELLAKKQAFFGKFKDTTGEIVNQATREIDNAKETSKKIVNLSVNASNLKDNICATFFEKIGLSKLNDKFENIYNGFSKIKYQNKYKELLEGLPEELQAKYSYEDWFENIISDVSKKFKGEGAKNFTKELFENAGIEKGMPIKDKARILLDKFSDEIMSDKRLSDVRIKYTDKIDISGIGLNPEQLAKIEKLNDLRLKAGNDIISRARDTVLGNPTADMTGVAVSLGLLGGALVTADSKEERKSTMINLGIPLLTTLASMTIAAARCISGGPALIFGLATGALASSAAGIIDNKIKEKYKEFEQNML